MRKRKRFLLRTIQVNSEGEFLVDNWYVEDTLQELVDKAYAVDSQRWEAYEAVEITTEAFLMTQAKGEQMQEIAELQERESRRRLYEALREEFEEDL